MGTLFKARIWVIRSGQNPDLTNIPTSEDSGWDPSAHRDLDSEVGKTVFFKEALLTSESPSLQVEYRLRVQKLDMDDFAQSYAYQPFFIVSIECLNDSTEYNIGIITGHNVSFAGDAL